MDLTTTTRSTDLIELIYATGDDDTIDATETIDATDETNPSDETDSLDFVADCRR